MPIALLPCWICLLMAGWLVRPSERVDWRKEWLAELWHRWKTLASDGERNHRSAWQIYVTASGCFQDAWSQWAMDEERWQAVRTETRRPLFFAAVLAAIIVPLALGSNFFSATRAILCPLAYSNGGRLALVTRTGRLQSVRKGIPANLAGFWRRDGKQIEAMAECSFLHQSRMLIGAQEFAITSLQTSENLMEVIGSPFTAPAGARRALLTYAFWQQQLHGDPKIVGKFLRHDQQSVQIAAVLPENFWLILPAVQVIELGSLPVNDQSMLLVRAKPHVSADQLEAELSGVAERHDIPFMETAPHVLFLTDALYTPVWLFGGALLIALVAVGLGRGSRLRRKERADSRLRFGNWQWWTFLLVKTAAALALVFVTGVEIFGGPALLWFYTAACSLVLLAVIADQQARCRVCLRCLAFPIRVGCPGCLFLDWSGTELLCPDGHGMLYVPHHVSCWDEAERWVALEI